MLHMDPHCRPTASQLLQHTWLTARLQLPTHPLTIQESSQLKVRLASFTFVLKLLNSLLYHAIKIYYLFLLHSMRVSINVLEHTLTHSTGASERTVWLSESMRTTYAKQLCPSKLLSFVKPLLPLAPFFRAQQVRRCLTATQYSIESPINLLKW